MIINFLQIFFIISISYLLISIINHIIYVICCLVSLIIIGFNHIDGIFINIRIVFLRLNCQDQEDDGLCRVRLSIIVNFCTCRLSFSLISPMRFLNLFDYYYCYYSYYYSYYYYSYLSLKTSYFLDQY